MYIIDNSFERNAELNKCGLKRHFKQGWVLVWGSFPVSRLVSTISVEKRMPATAHIFHISDEYSQSYQYCWVGFNNSFPSHGRTHCDTLIRTIGKYRMWTWHYSQPKQLLSVVMALVSCDIPCSITRIVPSFNLVACTWQSKHPRSLRKQVYIKVLSKVTTLYSDKPVLSEEQLSEKFLIVLKIRDVIFSRLEWIRHPYRL